MAKKMLILTGPQGAGNHLWSKIFSLHPEVYGWKTLLENYWEAHRFSEPFAQHWRDHTLLEVFDWTQSEYYFTSISCPMPDVFEISLKYAAALSHFCLSVL